MNYKLLEKLGLEKHLFSNNVITVKEVALGAGHVVFQSGDPCGAFLVLVSGCVRVDMTCKSGKEIMLYRMHENQTCIITTSVLLNNEDYYARATAETAVKAMVISRDDFYKALGASSMFTQYILKDYAKRITLLIQLLDNVGSKDIDYQLRQLLLKQKDRHGFVYITQEAMAKELVTAREVVSRKLSALEKAGALITHRGKVEIINEQLIK